MFPGLQGGPLMHVIAAKAVAFGEALQPDFKIYAQERRSPMPRRWPSRSRSAALDIVSGGTDTHLALVDLRPLAASPARTPTRRSSAPRSPATRTAIPYDPLPPVKTSGIRVGIARRHHPRLRPAEFREIGGMIADVLDGLRKNGEEGDGQVEAAVRAPRRRALCARFPIYQDL